MRGIWVTPMSGLASIALAASMSSSASIALAVSASSSVSFGGRPPVRPARRAAKPRFGALPDQAALDSANAPNMWKTNRSPSRGRCVVGFGQAAKTDAPNPKIFDGRA
jgi:hypothetical protein